MRNGKSCLLLTAFCRLPTAVCRLLQRRPDLFAHKNYDFDRGHALFLG